MGSAVLLAAAESPKRCAQTQRSLSRCGENGEVTQLATAAVN